MYSRMRASGFGKGWPYHPSTTCGPETPSPRISRPPERWSSVIAVIATQAGVRAEICMMPVPSLMLRCARADPAERRERVRAVGLRRPHRVVAEPLRLDGERRRIRGSEHPVAGHESELHRVQLQRGARAGQRERLDSREAIALYTIRTHALRRRPHRARRRLARHGDARLAGRVGRSRRARAHEAARPRPREAERADVHRPLPPPACRSRRARDPGGRDHAAQELERARLVPEGGSPARARPARLPQPARVQHLPQRLPVHRRARPRSRLRLRRRARPQPRHGRLLLRRPAPARGRLRAARRLRARPRDGGGGDRAGLQGAARAVGLSVDALAEPRRPVPGLGARAGGRPPDRVSRRRRRAAALPALLRQRPAAGARLPRRRRELPLGRLHGDPAPAHADARDDDHRRRPRSLPAPEGAA